MPGHSVPRECAVRVLVLEGLTVHFPQKSPISGSFA